jgi:hypothetical protein
MLLLGIYKFIYPLKDREKYSNKNPFPRTRSTTLEFVITFWAPFYYMIDIGITLYENRVFDWCRWPFFFHHVISVPCLILMNYRNYIPWNLLMLGGIDIIIYI